MDNFVRVYDNVMPIEMCNNLMDKFEDTLDMHEVQDNANGKTLTVVNMLGKKDSPFEDDVGLLFEILTDCVDRYKKDIGIYDFQWPKQFGLEPPKIKRYLPNGLDEFPEHVDVTGTDNLKRFLVLFVYLNNNDKGETIIHPDTPNVSDLYVSKCKQGSCLIFPPFWPWVHAGRPPIKEPKYIIGSYLHYV